MDEGLKARRTASELIVAEITRQMVLGCLVGNLVDDAVETVESAAVVALTARRGAVGQ